MFECPLGLGCIRFESWQEGVEIRVQAGAKDEEQCRIVSRDRLSSYACAWVHVDQGGKKTSAGVERQSAQRQNSNSTAAAAGAFIANRILMLPLLP